MSKFMQFDYLNLLGRKVGAVYQVEDSYGVQMLLLNFGSEILTIEKGYSDSKLTLDLFTQNEWQRRYEDIDVVRYYPYSCFEGKVIENIYLNGRYDNGQSLEISFAMEERRICVGVLGEVNTVLDLDIVRPKFTIDFGNKSIEEVDALINDKDLSNVRYVDMSNETRAVYYYYSCVDNVFELASYIHDVYNKRRGSYITSRPRAYELARKLIS